MDRGQWAGSVGGGKLPGWGHTKRIGSRGGGPGGGRTQSQCSPRQRIGLPRVERGGITTAGGERGERDGRGRALCTER